MAKLGCQQQFVGIEWQEVESEVKDFTWWKEAKVFSTFETGGGVEPVHQKSTWKKRRKDDWARLQTGRRVSLCSHGKIDDRQSVIICRARWSQESPL